MMSPRLQLSDATWPHQGNPLSPLGQLGLPGVWLRPFVLHLPVKVSCIYQHDCASSPPGQALVLVFLCFQMQWTF